MDKSNYIKVTDKDKNSTVVLAANKSYYKKQGFTISEPSEEEIEKYFPSSREIAGNIGRTDTSAIELELEKAKEALTNEATAHGTTKNLLTQEQNAHIATKGELEKAKEALTNALAEVEKLKKKA